jgi:hypothetical protein
MEELDLLKKHWKKEESSFQQVSEKQIYTMIHKNSSSIVKWIFIISILEFVVLNSFSFLFTDDKVSESKTVIILINILEYVSYAVALFFMYLFYKNYVSITVTSSTKKLIECILSTRKTVKYYIVYNLLLVVFVATIAISDMILFEPVFYKHWSVLFFTCFVMLFFIALLVGFVWLFYQLIYGILLKKLYKNYEELKKIDF